MGTAQALLIELTRRGIVLRVTDRQLRYSAPEGALTPDLKRVLVAHKPEIVSMYSGSQIPDALTRIADVWGSDIEVTGHGDAAWAWIKASDHWRVICAAENEVNRIGSRGDQDELNAACQGWTTAWVEAMQDWKKANGMTRAGQRSFNLGD